MRRHHIAIHFLIPLLCAGTLAPMTAYAQKPDWKEQGRPESPKGKGGSNQGNKGKSDQQRGGKQDSGTDRRDESFRQDRREKQPSRKETGRQESQKGKGGSNKGDQRQYDQPRGGDRQSGSESHRGSHPQDRRGDIGYGGYFGDQHRVVIRNYYTEQYRRGHCPPGLSKKNNRCLPPGQAKKWRIGHPLPRHVIFHDLPPAIALELGPAPAGYRFVRVASDILMIAVGTGLVMDAIQDLGGL